VLSVSVGLLSAAPGSARGISGLLFRGSLGSQAVCNVTKGKAKREDIRQWRPERLGH